MTPRSTQDKLTTAQRRRDALAGRLRGESYETIAERLGYANRSGAWKAVQEALRDTYREEANEYRELQLTRLEALLGPLYDRLQAGDTHASNAIVRALESMDRYTGYDKNQSGTEEARYLLHTLIDNSVKALEAQGKS